MKVPLAGHMRDTEWEMYLTPTRRPCKSSLHVNLSYVFVGAFIVRYRHLSCVLAAGGTTHPVPRRMDQPRKTPGQIT
jgi:hypothetical protein